MRISSSADILETATNILINAVLNRCHKHINAVSNRCHEHIDAVSNRCHEHPKTVLNRSHTYLGVTIDILIEAVADIFIVFATVTIYHA